MFESESTSPIQGRALWLYYREQWIHQSEFLEKPIPYNPVMIEDTAGQDQLLLDNWRHPFDDATNQGDQFLSCLMKNP